MEKTACDGGTPWDISALAPPFRAGGSPGPEIQTIGDQNVYLTPTTTPLRPVNLPEGVA